MSLKIYQPGERDFHNDLKVKKVLILGESGVGKSHFASYRNDTDDNVLDLDAFVYQKANKEWDHFSFVENYIKDAYAMFAVAHHVRDSIKELFDVVIDTREYDIRLTHEQILSTYIRDHIRGFDPVYKDTNYSGCSFDVIASDIKARYKNSVFCSHTWKFRFAEYLLMKYEEKQKEKYNFCINILEHNWRTQNRNTVFKVSENLYSVAYGAYEYLVETHIRPKVDKNFSSIEHFSRHMLFNPRSVAELKVIKTLDESDTIYNLLVTAASKVKPSEHEFAAKFLTELVFYMNEITDSTDVKAIKRQEDFSSSLNTLLQAVLQNRK